MLMVVAMGMAPELVAAFTAMAVILSLIVVL